MKKITAVFVVFFTVHLLVPSNITAKQIASQKLNTISFSYNFNKISFKSENYNLYEIKPKSVVSFGFVYHFNDKKNNKAGYNSGLNCNLNHPDVDKNIRIAGVSIVNGEFFVWSVAFNGLGCHISRQNFDLFKNICCNIGWNLPFIFQKEEKINLTLPLLVLKGG